jgi:hypothetical protein
MLSLSSLPTIYVFFWARLVCGVHKCIYIFFSFLFFSFLTSVNVQENLCPYISVSPHPWWSHGGAPVLGSSMWRFSGEGCLPKIVMTASSPGKGITSSSMGASLTSMLRDKDLVAMKFFIRLQSQSLCLMG